MAKKKVNTPDELSELETAYQKITGNSKRRAKSKRVATVLVYTLSVVLLAAIGVSMWFLFGNTKKIIENASVAGLDLSGMTEEEAKEALTAKVNELYGSRSMVVTVGDTTIEIPAKDANIQVDLDTIILQAREKGGKLDLTSYLTVDEDAVQKVVDQFDAKYNAELVPTTEAVEGILPSLTSSTTEEGTGQVLVIQIGTPALGLDTEALRQSILEAYRTDNFLVTAQFSTVEPEIPTADALFQKYLEQNPVVDAVMDPTTFDVIPEKFGYSIDVSQAEKLLANAQYGDTVRIPFALIVPKTVAADLESLLYRDILGECSTPYSGADTNNRNTNLGIVCEKLNGMILMPGEEFSYNKTLGERTAANGWKPAPSYVNGLTVDTYGGGICQGSTTLYNCVLQADFTLVEVYPHSYVSTYVPHGMDASVNWGTADFRFVNSSNYPIRIEAYRENGKMTMRIHGTDEKDYYIKMTYEDISFKAYKTVYEEVDPANNPNGYKDGQELVSPYTGLRVKTYKNKYDKETNELIETTLERDITYNHRDRVVVKFVSKTEPSTGGEGTGGTEGSGGTEGPGGTEGSGSTEGQDPGTETP